MFSAYLHNSDMHAFRDNPPPSYQGRSCPLFLSYFNLSTITYVTAKPPSIHLQPLFHSLLHITISLFFFFFFFFFFSLSHIHCQLARMQPTDDSETDEWSIHDRSLPIVLTFILLLFFIVGFFSLYLFRHVMEYLRTLHRRPVAARRGLPASIISSFPTFPYSAVKDRRHSNDKPECTVCLADFSDDDTLRMLTGCTHVFHQECIDLWLATRTTCPICRRDLDHGNNNKVGVVIQMPESNSSRGGEGEAVAERHEHRNSFKEDGAHMEGHDHDMDGRSQHRDQLPGGQLSRSHSTGNLTEGKFRD